MVRRAGGPDVAGRVRPGVAVRGSSTGRPLMAAMDLFGRRWTLRVLWELRSGPLGARAVLALCDGLSSSVFYERLRELTDAGLLEQYDDDTYGLTDLGAALGVALKPLDAWSQQWAKHAHSDL
jgi:DNA-binding HxlR family transcriptional regulator